MVWDIHDATKAARTAPTLPSRAHLLASPCTSYWLQKALAEAWQRDPVDALRDAEILVRLLKERLNP